MRALAVEHGLPVIDQPDDIPECDYLISVQYHAILRAGHLERARRDAINLHLAPLPEYRGCNQFSLAILNQDVSFGVTLHRMDAGVDSGDILFEDRFALRDGLWVEDVVRIANERGAALFERSLPQIVAGNYAATPQADLVAERGTSTCRRRDIEEMKVVNLGWDAEHIARTIRATAMPGFPPPYANVGGRRVEFTVVSEEKTL